MQYLINGRGGFIGYEVSGNILSVELVWLDKWCPETIDLAGVGTVQIPKEIAKANVPALIPNLQLKILKPA